MEGSWRALAAWLAATLAGCALMVGASGCGDDDGDDPRAESPAGVKTANPLRTFAPLVEVAADEPWRPMSARWFLERAVLGFAEDRGCPDRKIAVGHTLPEQHTEEFDWIFPKGLGSGPTYYRNPYGRNCKLNFDVRLYADQLTRPHDPGARIDGTRPGQGYYMDLVDEARGGPVASGGDLAEPVYAERIDEGDGSVRLTYWLLFGMHGTPGEPDAHEGDWERIDVLLDEEDDDRLAPRAVQLPHDGGARDSAWRATRRIDGTHPVIRMATATHQPTAAPAGESCGSCLRWPAWESLANAREELWYGFGGAWGEPGDGDGTTGPLGPHRFFPSASEKEQEVFGDL